MENGLHSDMQWGLTPGRSTTTALLSVFHIAMRLAENGNDIGLVFFDLRKAFYSVPHQPLLEKLEETGLNRHLLQWIGTTYVGIINMLWWTENLLPRQKSCQVYHRALFSAHCYSSFVLIPSLWCHDQRFKSGALCR